MATTERTGTDQTERRRPNILFILSDDQGAWALGAAGNEEIITPNLDRLAASGTRMAQFFCASPVCSPARASLMTGAIPSRHGVLDWLRGGNVEREALEGLESHRYFRESFASEHGAIGYLDGQVCYTDLLAENGYELRLAGKWHLGDSLRPQHGFTGWHTIARGGCHYYGSDIVQDGQIAWIEQYITDWITERALDDLDELLERPETPWYLSVHYTAPHSPWDYSEHPESVRRLYDDCAFDSVPDEALHPWQIATAPYPTSPEQRRELLTGYYSAVTAMDMGIGRLLARLEAAGRLEDTLIVFMGDNGMNMGHHGIWGKGNGTFPFNMYDSSVLVPCLVHWPAGGVAEGAVEDGLWSQYDIIHSLRELAGLEGPLSDALPARAELPGRSFAAALRGEADETPERPLVVFDEYGPTRMLRTTVDKYVCRAPYGPEEYYRLDRDPEERENLIDDPAWRSRIAALRRELLGWFAQYADPGLDGSREPVSGSGQLDRAGIYGTRDEVFAPIPRRIVQDEA